MDDYWGQCHSIAVHSERLDDEAGKIIECIYDLAGKPLDLKELRRLLGYEPEEE